jgi:hypothetical protein
MLALRVSSAAFSASFFIMRSRWVPIASLACSLSTTYAGGADAHALLDNPPARDQQDGYKDGTACGVSFAAGQPVTSFAPGQTINVQWLETVDHPGCFLVEFSAGADQDFQILGRKSHSNPPPPEAATSGEPRHWSLEVTLPATACTGCTLRLRQLMLDADVAADACPPATLAPRSIYTTCANLVLGSGGSTSTPAPDTDGGCHLRATRGPSLGFATALVVAAMLRRRRKTPLFRAARVQRDA